MTSNEAQQILTALAGIEGRLDAIEGRQNHIVSELEAVKADLADMRSGGPARKVIERSIADLSAVQAQLENAVVQLNDRLTVLVSMRTLDALASQESGS